MAQALYFEPHPPIYTAIGSPAAIQRDGSPCTALQAGDVLLLDTGSRFLSSHRGDRNFALVAEVSNSQPPRFDRLALALTCAAAAIAIYIAGLIHLFTAAATASAVMLAAGCLSADAARRSIKWEVVVTIAAAFGISNALENTGALRVLRVLGAAPVVLCGAHGLAPRRRGAFGCGPHPGRDRIPPLCGCVAEHAIGPDVARTW